MIQTRRKKLTEHEAQLKYSSRRLKYVLKYHTGRYPVDVAAKTIEHHEHDIDSLVTTIVSNKRLTRVKIKSLLQFIYRHTGPKTEQFINIFLDCLIDQSDTDKNIIVDSNNLRDGYLHPCAWTLFDKISGKINRKK